MELLEIKVGGIRNIKNTHLRLGENITSLVSTNNYGKSNVIKAIRFLTLIYASYPCCKEQNDVRPVIYSVE